MSRLCFEQEEWYFSELSRKWSMEEARLRRLVIRGDLRPRMRVNAAFQEVRLLEHGAEAVGDPQRLLCDLWAPPENAVRTGDLELVYEALRDTPEATEDSRYFLPMQGGALAGLPTLTDVLASFVVSDDNRKAVEAAYGPQDADRDLDEREERTRDIMLVTMAMELYGWEPGSERSTGATELMEQAKSKGFPPLSYPTVRKHFNLAWKRCPPRLDPAGDARREYDTHALAKQ